MDNTCLVISRNWRLVSWFPNCVPGYPGCPSEFTGALTDILNFRGKHSNISQTPCKLLAWGRSQFQHSIMLYYFQWHPISVKLDFPLVAVIKCKTQINISVKQEMRVAGSNLIPKLEKLCRAQQVQTSHEKYLWVFENKINIICFSFNLCFFNMPSKLLGHKCLLSCLDLTNTWNC